VPRGRGRVCQGRYGKCQEVGCAKVATGSGTLSKNVTATAGTPECGWHRKNVSENKTATAGTPECGRQQESQCGGRRSRGGIKYAPRSARRPRVMKRLAFHGRRSDQAIDPTSRPLTPGAIGGDDLFRGGAFCGDESAWESLPPTRLLRCIPEPPRETIRVAV
jgi:hypothetical protein